MSNETPPVKRSFDPLSKTNLFDLILCEKLRGLKNIELEDATLTLQEYEEKYEIAVPEQLIEIRKNCSWLYFNRKNEEEYARNDFTQVNAFIFSLEDKFIKAELYTYTGMTDSNSINALRSQEEMYLKKCFRVCAELVETYEDKLYREIFYFDIFGNIDSVRIRIAKKPTETAIKKFIEQLIKRKHEFSEYLTKLEADKNLQKIKEKEEFEAKKARVEAKKANHPVFGPYMHKLPKCLYGIHSEIEHADHDWDVHEGDLIIDSNWQADNINLIITGNLHVQGVYDGYSKGFSFVVVLGDMTAEHIVCWYGLSVVGNLTVNGIISIEHYIFPFEIAGDLHARHLSIHHSDRNVHWNNLSVETVCYCYLESDQAAILKNISPALLAENIVDHNLDDIYTSFSATVSSLLRGESPFRETPLSDQIVEKIIQYADENNDTELTQEDLREDMSLDPLLALVIANYIDISNETLNYLKKYIGIYGKEFDEKIIWTIENKI